MMLENLKNEIVESITDAIREAKMSGERYACVTVDVESGYLDVSTDEDNNRIVCVWHDDKKKDGHVADRLESWAEGFIPDWWNIEVEEDDEEENDGVDAGFSGWNDFIEYMYG